MYEVLMMLIITGLEWTWLSYIIDIIYSKFTQILIKDEVLLTVGVKPVIQPIRAKNIYKSSLFF